MFDRSGIRRAVLVLGPGIPAYQTLFQGMAQHPSRIRGVGILCGSSVARRMEAAELQMRAGVVGLRMEPRELEENPEVLELLGSEGRWIFAVGAADATRVDTLTTIHRWLDRHPRGRVAAPHFLASAPVDAATGGGHVLTELIRHPRFFPIFSRQGGVGSRTPYPHEDLAPWVRQVIDLAGATKVLWGSEFPVAYWRNETMGQCQRWLADLDPSLDGLLLESFWSENARRLFFSEPVSPGAMPAVPAWVDGEFDIRRKVPLLPSGVLHLSATAYQRLFAGFLRTLPPSPDAHLNEARLSKYLEGVLEAHASSEGEEE
jgi:hypothetical protein